MREKKGGQVSVAQLYRSLEMGHFLKRRFEGK